MRCPFCRGRRGDDPTEPGLEPTRLEREARHAAHCPLLDPSKPLRALAPLAMIAAMTAAGPAGCGGRAGDGDFGLDNGTLGRVEVLDQDAALEPA